MNYKYQRISWEILRKEKFTSQYRWKENTKNEFVVGSNQKL